MKKLHIASAWLLILIILMVSAFSQNECVCTETLPCGIERIHANCVWDNNRDMVVDPFANAGYSRIAVIDTGIDYYVDSAEHKVYHPDLRDNVAEGHGFEYDGIEVRIRDDHKDDDGHGTHVTGIIAAVDNEIGVIGTAPKARIYALKYCSWQEDEVVKEIVAAIDWAVDNYIPIISISLGFSTDYAELRQACDNAYAQRVLLIAAAGNENGPVCYPAAYDSVIAVGAVDNNGQRWVQSAEQGSNFGPQLEFVAPGVNINSTERDGNYGVSAGTSEACPHVAAVAALVWSSKIDPNYDLDENGYWSNDEVRLKLRHLALDLGQAGKDDYYGYGLINAWAINQRPLGNINNDLTVNYRDGIILGAAFGSRPGDVNWDPRADINIDNTVNFADATIIGSNFGKVDP